MTDFTPCGAGSVAFLLGNRTRQPKDAGAGRHYNRGMSKEARANLIFLVVLAIVIAPGFIILVKRKLAETGQPNFLPDPVPHAAAFNQPPPVPPSVPRKEPAEVRGWVTSQIQQRFNPKAALVRTADGSAPVMGDRYLTQLTMLNHDDAKNLRVAMVVWDASATVATAPAKIVIKSDGVDTPADATDGFQLEVPADVRHALQAVGYIDPPTRVLMVSGTFVGLATDTPQAVVLTLTSTDGKSVSETVTLRR